MAAKVYRKNIRRTIFGSLGRYIAILAIIALGVGFFVGIKDTRAAMLKTCNKYFTEYNMYDYRLLSNYGFTEEDAQALGDMKEVKSAQGAFSMDFFSQDMNGNSVILRAHSIMQDINNLKMLDGRLPKNDKECVVDEHFAGSKYLGREIKVTKENDTETQEAFNDESYTIVGIVRSPYYVLKTERGTTSLGDGSISGFVYLQRDCFTSEYYTEMFLTCKEQGYIYSKEYDDNIKAAEGAITDTAQKRGNIRFVDIKAEAQKEIDEGRKALEESKAEFAKEKADAYKTLSDSKNLLNEKRAELNSGKVTLASQKADLIDQKSSTEAGLAQLRQDLALAESEVPQSPEKIQGLKTQIAQTEGALQAMEGGLSQIAAREKEIASGEKGLRTGYRQYEEGKVEADAKFAEAEVELTKAEKDLKSGEKELADLDKPKLYVQTRDDNGGYSNFESNSEIVDGIAKVFPVFFFLIAALVCSTTMSRMIEEERTQIGTFRALGYTKGRIMWKYMLYSGSAAVIGCVGGFLAGSKYFPVAIWTAYGMMFGFAELEFHFNVTLAIISLVVSLICSAGTTYMACRGQLKGTPAEILRPRAPKAGKRIFLEKITFLWKKLKFLHKVSARNVFRYKKRMTMMILGIAGCTALVIAGFGINDSVAGLADHQYSKVETYDTTVMFSEAIDDDKYQQINQVNRDDIENATRVEQVAVNASGNGVSKTCYLMISADENLSKSVSFKNHGVKQKLPENGEALVSDGLAEKLELNTGDRIEVKYDDTKKAELTISGIYENYVSNYIYINENTYKDVFNKDYEPILLFLTFKDGVDIRDASAKVNETDGAAGAFLNEDTKIHVNDMMESLNFIVILVIGCAGALAFIVLFNLSNINITEREREIATIKVLGFYPRETGTYVFRENLVLTVMGIIVGIPLGYILHAFIMNQIVVDMVSFNEVIEIKSYILTVIIVIGFSLVVDVIMRQKLKRINMAEALKSIE
ncbi:MAG: FtsX-like permease family protein [Clostridiales bacterium]|nr:FtsX-like permease family protein [Clostridiales bacterium]